MNNKKIITIISLIVIVLGVIYLSNFKKNPAENSITNDPITNMANSASTTMPVKDIGMANPASVFCTESGGALEIIDTPEGQMGNCTLPNGTVCEEWALFRGECK